MNKTKIDQHMSVVTWSLKTVTEFAKGLETHATTREMGMIHHLTIAVAEQGQVIIELARAVSALEAIEEERRMGS